MSEVQAGYGRLVLGFSHKEAFDNCVKQFGLQYSDDDIAAFLISHQIDGETFWLLRCERKKALHDPLGDKMHLMVPGIWRESARFVYSETVDGLVESKHSGCCDQVETKRQVNALVTLNMPVFKGRMSHPLNAIQQWES